MKPQENHNFLKNGKIVRNLATSSNFVEFRDSQKFDVFRGNGGSVAHLAHFEWLTVCHVSCAELVNLCSSVGPTWTCGIP